MKAHNEEGMKFRHEFKIAEVWETMIPMFDPPYFALQKNGDFKECAVSCFAVAGANLLWDLGVINKEEYALTAREVAYGACEADEIVRNRGVLWFLHEYELCERIKFYDQFCKDLRIEEILGHLTAGFDGVLSYYYDSLQVGHSEFVKISNGEIFMNGIKAPLSTFVKRCFCNERNHFIFAKRKKAGEL